MTGKEISFEAVPKNNQHWSLGDVRQQAIPRKYQIILLGYRDADM